MHITSKIFRDNNNNNHHHHHHHHHHRHHHQIIRQLPSHSSRPIHQSDWQARVEGFLCRSVRYGYCSPDIPTFAEQCTTADEKFFEKSASTITTYCTVSFLRLQLPDRATTFDLECTACNYRNILTIWLTPILSHECFLLTFTKLFFFQIADDEQYQHSVFSLCLSVLSICSCVLSTCL